MQKIQNRDIAAASTKVSQGQGAPQFQKIETGKTFAKFGFRNDRNR
jgi:hypothetical protein